MKRHTVKQSAFGSRQTLWIVALLLSACTAPQYYIDLVEGTEEAEAAYDDGRYQDTVDAAEVTRTIPIESKDRYIIKKTSEILRRLRFVQGEANLKLGNIEGLDEELLDLRGFIYLQRLEGWNDDFVRLDFMIARVLSMQGRDIEAVNRLLFVSGVRSSPNSSDEEIAARQKRSNLRVDRGWLAGQSASGRVRVRKVIRALEEVLRQNPGSIAALNGLYVFEVR